MELGIEPGPFRGLPVFETGVVTNDHLFHLGGEHRNRTRSHEGDSTCSGRGAVPTTALLSTKSRDARTDVYERLDENSVFMTGTLIVARPQIVKRYFTTARDSSTRNSI